MQLIRIKIMTTIRITENNSVSQRFIEYARSLPFVAVEETTQKKMTFEEASVKYNCISVDEFTDKLNLSIKEYFHPSCEK